MPNLPNTLSLLRIALVPFFLAALLPGPLAGIEGDAVLVGGYAAAALLVMLAALTDYLDGVIARRRNLTTNLGRLLDPLADKVFVAAALIALVELRALPAWAVVLIIAREFLLTGLRSIAAEQGRVIAADPLGKAKTVLQFALIFAGIGWLAVGRLAGREWAAGTVWIVDVLLGVVLAVTVASAWNYLRANADVLREQRAE